MKRLFLILVFALAAIACAAPTETGNKPAPTNTNSSTEAISPPLSEAEVIAKEKQAWDAVKTKDAESFRKIMADNGMYVSHHGLLDPAGTIDETKELELTDLSFADWKVLPIDQDAVLVTYTANINGRIKGMPLVSSQVRSTTAWVNREGKWLAIYHQDSEAKSTPAPGAKKPVPATSKPSPMPETSTGADPIANEKIIWDALKSNNFDGFAALLAADSVEVEPDGLYDKFGSVKSVSQTDFSKAALSEWKALKIDDHAALVTYLVKIPGVAPEGEHHTTIWVNRGGKWLALFHQGTPVLKELKPVSEKPGASPAAKPKAPKVKY